MSRLSHALQSSASSSASALSGANPADSFSISSSFNCAVETRAVGRQQQRVKRISVKRENAHAPGSADENLGSIVAVEAGNRAKLVRHSDSNNLTLKLKECLSAWQKLYMLGHGLGNIGIGLAKDALALAVGTETAGLGTPVAIYLAEQGTVNAIGGIGEIYAGLTGNAQLGRAWSNFSSSVGTVSEVGARIVSTYFIGSACLIAIAADRQ